MSVNAIGGMSAAHSSAGGSSAPLSDATKKKLEALGIDTSKIKTESEGQQKLKEAEAAQASQATQGQQSNAGQAQAIKDQASALAASVGVSVSKGDKISDILDHIQTKLSTMNAQAGQDPQKVQELKQYQSEFTVIASEYASLQSQQQASKSQLTGSMDSMAAYNKIFHKL